MPCHVCHVRQSDPDRGASPWKRAVAAGEQVLVCPLCQLGTDWQSLLDHCSTCGSMNLVRALGETTCRACGRVEPVGVDKPVEPSRLAAPAPVADLAGEVDAAIRRVLGER